MSTEPSQQASTQGVSPERRAFEVRKVIVQRARRLRALMGSSNQNESQVATVRFEALVREHQITQAEIEHKTLDDVREHKIDGEFSDMWKISLLTIIGRTFDARTIRKAKFVMKGKKAVQLWEGRVIALNRDAHAVACNYAYYVAAVESLLKAKGYGDRSEDDKDSYRHGVVFGLQQIFDGSTMPAEAKKVLEEEWPDEASSADLVKTSNDVSKTPEVKEATQKETLSFLDKQHPGRRKQLHSGQPKNLSIFYIGVSNAMEIPPAKMTPTIGDPL